MSLTPIHTKKITIPIGLHKNYTRNAVEVVSQRLLGSLGLELYGIKGQTRLGPLLVNNAGVLATRQRKVKLDDEGNKLKHKERVHKLYSLTHNSLGQLP